MTAIVAGEGLGLLNTSLSQLNGAGASGQPKVGNGVDGLFINVVNGNVVVQGQDDYVASVGFDASALRVYNSQGLMEDDNGDNWSLAFHRRLINPPATGQGAALGQAVLNDDNARKAKQEMMASGVVAQTTSNANAGDAEPVWGFKEASMALRRAQDAQAQREYAAGLPGMSAWDGKSGLAAEPKHPLYNSFEYQQAMSLQEGFGAMLAPELIAAKAAPLLAMALRSGARVAEGLGTLFAGTSVARLAANPVATSIDEAFFWSGRTNGIGGADVAQGIASKEGGTTFETLIADRGIKMPAWDATNPDVVKAWQNISAQYAQGASGAVRAVIGQNLRPGNVWQTTELPALMANPGVKQVITIDPATGARNIVYTRGGR